MSVLEPKLSKVLLSLSVDRNVKKVSLFLHCYFEVLSNSYLNRCEWADEKNLDCTVTHKAFCFL